MNPMLNTMNTIASLEGRPRLVEKSLIRRNIAMPLGSVPMNIVVKVRKVTGATSIVAVRYVANVRQEMIAKIA